MRENVLYMTPLFNIEIWGNDVLRFHFALVFYGGGNLGFHVDPIEHRPACGIGIEKVVSWIQIHSLRIPLSFEI